MIYKDSRGVWATISLFGDRAGEYRDCIVFETILEARKKFIELGDPTGILFSDKYLGGYDHWKALKASKGLEPDISAWEEELEVRMRSDALMGIKAMSKDQFQAAKLILDRGWDKKAGRPSKASVEKETRVQSKLKLAYSDDIKRIER